MQVPQIHANVDRIAPFASNRKGIWSARISPEALMTTKLTRRAAIAGALAATTLPARAQTLDKVSFGTNWVAEAEHGGFYQSVADGTYRKYGLDVTIIPGGPQANNRM